MAFCREGSQLGREAPFERHITNRRQRGAGTPFEQADRGRAVGRRLRRRPAFRQGSGFGFEVDLGVEHNARSIHSRILPMQTFANETGSPYVTDEWGVIDGATNVGDWDCVISDRTWTCRRISQSREGPTTFDRLIMWRSNGASPPRWPPSAHSATYPPAPHYASGFLLRHQAFALGRSARPSSKPEGRVS